MSIHGEGRFEAKIYLDHHYPPIQWNIVRGMFCTPNCLEESKKNALLSISMASMLLNDTAERLISELSLEEIRKKHYPDNVSRIYGVFVFDDQRSFEKIRKNNDWGAYFKDEYLADVGVAANKSSRLDSNWISEIFDSKGKLFTDWESAAHNYWQGIPHPDKEPIWERIIEGYVTIWSMDSKMKALKEIQSIWPQSLNILRYAVLCAGYGSSDGQIFPILSTSEGKLKLSYYLRLAHRGDDTFITRLNDFIKDNPKFNCGLHCEGEELLPDLSGFSKEITPDSSGGFGDMAKHIMTLRQLYQSP
ncbi:hypothetical protein [Aeromonas sp. S9(2024)]|uniref:hypothetical protein n=1 Tax=Aeromonas sp. S9(2024) TaxID=3242882 RepID=UPI003528FA0E